MVKTNEALTRGVADILPSKKGLADLMSKKKIKLYLGIDPTGTKLHLGHTVPLRKLQQFADLGHEVILLFGTGTVLVGDPSQRDTARKLITQREIEKNIKTWKKQAAPILDFEKIKIKQNGDWLLKLNLKDIINIASKISAIQLFKRDMFQKRLDKGDTVLYHETMYPLLQGYDSVVMDVDLEIGGTDQIFNMLIGRELQQKMNKKEKFVLTMPMITGLDGKQMSKTSGNCVWLTDSADEMFGKLMSISDNQTAPYTALLTDLPISKITNPLKAKKKLAWEIAKIYHSEKEANEAQNKFEKTFQKRAPEYNIKISKGILVRSLVEATGISASEVKRRIVAGAVDIDDKTVKKPSTELEGGEKIKFGKKSFYKVKK
jgi:tyrosyl-tRNA synthetase